MPLALSSCYLCIVYFIYIRTVLFLNFTFLFALFVTATAAAAFVTYIVPSISTYASLYSLNLI